MFVHLRAFEPERLGHGVRSIEDPALLEYLKAQRIHLEVCPSSNVQTRVVEEYASEQVHLFGSAAGCFT